MKNKSPSFLKEQIVTSNKFARTEKDLLKTLLEDDKGYTLKECEKVIKEFNEKEVL